jgi:plasmid stability protein
MALLGSELAGTGYQEGATALPYTEEWRILLGLTHVSGCAIIDSMKTRRMTQLIVRNLEEEVVRELKIQAARHGRSAEAEHREILREALLPEKKRRPVKEVLLAMPPVGEDSDFERIPDRGRDVEL